MFRDPEEDALPAIGPELLLGLGKRVISDALSERPVHPSASNPLGFRWIASNPEVIAAKAQLPGGRPLDRNIEIGERASALPVYSSRDQTNWWLVFFVKTAMAAEGKFSQ